MTGFEPKSSGVRIDRAENCASATAPKKIIISLPQIPLFESSKADWIPFLIFDIKWK